MTIRLNSAIRRRPGIARALAATETEQRADRNGVGTLATFAQRRKIFAHVCHALTRLAFGPEERVFGPAVLPDKSGLRELADDAAPALIVRRSGRGSRASDSRAKFQRKNADQEAFRAKTHKLPPIA
jgi:hypothetical protein